MVSEGAGAGNFGGAKPASAMPVLSCPFVVGSAKHQHPRTGTGSHNTDGTMSRQSMAPQRNLSLTEELEKLEQSITLTLQGKQGLACPANATDEGRNRPELQPRASHRHIRHPAHCRAVWEALGSRVGGLQVLEAVL